MKGALVLSAEPDLFGAARDVVVARGGTAVEDAAQLRGPDGFLLTVFRDEYPGDDFRDEPFTAADGGDDVPSLTEVHGVPVECRSEALFVDVVQAVAALVAQAGGGVDDASVVGPAARQGPTTRAR